MNERGRAPAGDRTREAPKGRAVTATAVLRQAMRRIERWNPALGALTEVLAERAAKEALAVDSRRAQGQTLPEIAGMPIVVKDIIDTTPAVCSAGLPFLAGYRPRRDALVVRRLRRSGAVVLGVSATDPGAFGVRTPAVTHPQAPDHTVGGSSGGSAAAVAAGFCVAALGTDTGGSVRIPSACCLTVGFMPSPGRVPATGVRPLAWSLDHVGVMARQVADIVSLQRVLDARFTFAGHLQGRGRVRIGYDPGYFRDAAPEVSSGVSDALDAARKLGAKVDEVSLPNPDEATAVHTIIFCSEAAAYHLAAFPDRLDDYPPLARELFRLSAKVAIAGTSMCRRRGSVRFSGSRLPPRWPPSISLSLRPFRSSPRAAPPPP